MKAVCNHIKAKGAPEETTLFDHLHQVADVTVRIAEYLGMDQEVARQGAVLHDIGKASTVFQKRLTPQKGRNKNQKTFRHEIASCFFLSLFDKEIHPQLIEMVIGHHKSIRLDAMKKGILDLYQEEDEKLVSFHLTDFEKWKGDALTILDAFGIKTHDISLQEATKNFEEVYDYCTSLVKDQRRYSDWRGLLISADHFASALDKDYSKYLSRLFVKPDLSFYNRTSKLYPLSLCSADSSKSHTIVVACTGAGKTDYLFRRCKGRVFYTLPFQASINAMYKRVKHDLTPTNPDLDIRLLHASSQIVSGAGSLEERIIQGHVGASVKVLTPYQIAAIAFATKGFEAIIEDIKGCDVILDEVHTYADISRSIILKLIEVLKQLNCRIHIGTATMPSLLYDKIIQILGKDNVEEIKLEQNQLEDFNRHIVYKKQDFEECKHLIKKAVVDKQKILIVCNRIAHAQELYLSLKEQYDIPILLIHSRFKRGDREEKEQLLMGLDANGNATFQYNTSSEACIVVSTQVVEVSLDISFDLMITEAAPLDALIQRFGRINRKRNASTIGHYKPIYVLSPPEDEKEAKPYNLEIVKRSYDELPDGEVVHESQLQQMIDCVFTTLDVAKIEEWSVFKKDGTFKNAPLTNNKKAVLLDLLEIDSVNCICKSDVDAYAEMDKAARAKVSLSTNYWRVKELDQLNYGTHPFIIPDAAYDKELGFIPEKASNEYFSGDSFQL